MLNPKNSQNLFERCCGDQYIHIKPFSAGIDELTAEAREAVRSTLGVHAAGMFVDRMLETNPFGGMGKFHQRLYLIEDKNGGPGTGMMKRELYRNGPEGPGDNCSTGLTTSTFKTQYAAIYEKLNIPIPQLSH
jgi:hypothetical protein